jgi:TP901 family phage tail tape measure protein
MATSLNIGTILAKLGLNAGQFFTTMAKADAVTKGFKKTANSTSAATTKMGANMKKAMLGIGAALIGSVVASVKFNKEMSNIATLMPQSTSKVVELKDRIQDLAIAAGKSTSDVAGGAYQVVSAFGEAAAESEKLDITVRAAAAGMATTTDALNLLSATTKGYGDTTDEAFQHAADLAFTTVRLGQTTFPELAASIGKTIPIAAKMNVSTEELFASFATLTGVTGSAAEVSTQLSGILGAMIKPTGGMKDAIKALEFSTAEAMIQELGLVESLKQLIAKTDGTSVSLGKLVRRKEALTAITALTGKSADVFTMKYKEMTNVAGATDTAWKAITEGINKTGFALEQAKQQIIVAAQNLGDFLVPALASLLKLLTPILKSVTSLFKALSALPDILKNISIGAAAVTFAFMKWGKWGVILTAVSAALSLLPKKIDSVRASTTLANEQSAIQFKSYAQLRDKLLSYGASLREIHDAMIDYRNDSKGNIRTDKERLEMVVANIDGTKTSYAATGKLRAAIISLTKERKKDTTEIKKHTARTDEETGKVVEIVRSAHEKYMQYTLTENQFRRWQIEQTYKEERQTMIANKASKAELVQLEKAKQAELTQITKEEEEERRAIKGEALTEQKSMIQEYWETLAAMQEERYEQFKLMDEEAEFEALLGREREIEEFRRHYEMQKEIIKDKWMSQKITTMAAQAELLKLRKSYNVAINKSDENQYQQWLNRMMEMTKKQREAFNAGMAVFTSYLNAKQKKLDVWYENERKKIEQSKRTEEQKQTALAALDDEYEKRRVSIARKVAIAEKAQNIATATMNVATAITKALAAAPPPFNYILAAAVGLVGAAWIATIARTPLPMAEGGMTKSEGLALLHPNEVVMPAEKIPDIVNNITTEGGGGLTLHVNIHAWDSSDMITSVQQKLAPALEELYRTGQLAVPENAVVKSV